MVGLLAAALAFLASYLVYPTYESSTRLLVHGRDATFLSSTGEDLASQPGVVDASLSQALLSTYAGIATSRTVAVAVTDELALDQKPPSTSPYAAVAQGVRVGLPLRPGLRHRRLLRPGRPARAGGARGPGGHHRRTGRDERRRERRASRGRTCSR